MTGDDPETFHTRACRNCQACSCDLHADYECTGSLGCYTIKDGRPVRST